MRILIEEHKYKVADVADVLHGLDALENVDGFISVHYVGYYYNSHINDCAFILPKVLMDERELVFGKYSPEGIINLNENNPLDKAESEFLYSFAVWIYRAIVVYKNSNQDNTIIYHKQASEMGKGKLRKSNTYLDILLSLIQFNKDNQSLIFTILRNIHSGFNKINWTRTISRTSAIIQDGSPIYLNPVNKKRQVNFDEELLIIFYSILNYIGDFYGFPKDIKCQFQLITGKRFETYLNGFGKTRLHQIKYRYFSDKALQLWNLCYAFFEQSKHIAVNVQNKEYLLVKNFYIVFEAIIDELIGDKKLSDGMNKKQEDGKIVDHMFTAKSLIENAEGNNNIYYIGDSKYYKMGHPLGKESIAKQFTYARNVTQFNLDIFNTGGEAEIKLRDDVTEGYNIIPNFFISATMDKKFNYDNDGLTRTVSRETQQHKNYHFENRLFDRDTLLLYHYDVNFLYVLSLYARNNEGQKSNWKKEVRNRFRDDIRRWLQKDYKFYAMKAHPDVNAQEYIKANFNQLNGKIYTPFADGSIYSLALETKDNQYSAENAGLLDELSKAFYVTECDLANNPVEKLESVEAKGYKPFSNTVSDGVLMVEISELQYIKTGFPKDSKLAVAVRFTKENMELIENLRRIGYVLYHTRSDKHKRMFAVVGEARIIMSEEVGSDRHKNIEGAKIYISVDIDTSNEINSDTYFVRNIITGDFIDPNNARYATLAQLAEIKS